MALRHWNIYQVTRNKVQSRERTCSKYTKVVMRLWNAAKICKRSPSLCMQRAHTLQKNIALWFLCVMEWNFIYCLQLRQQREALAQTHAAAAKHVFIFHPICRAHEIFYFAPLFLSFSLRVCVPRFAARVITACRNKLANTNINRELRKRVVVVALSDDCWLAYFPGDDGRKKVGGC
jgi:hypothetical protein